MSAYFCLSKTKGPQILVVSLEFIVSQTIGSSYDINIELSQCLDVGNTFKPNIINTFENQEG